MINNMPSTNNTMAVSPGTILSTPRPLYRHFGVTTDRYINGQPTVISNSGQWGMVVEETLGQFQGQGDIKIEGYWGKLPPHEVLARARQKLGTKYYLFGWNCEHFVRYVHGLNPESPQIIAYALLALVVFGLSRA